MFDNLQFREVILRPALKDINLYSLEAEELLVGTMAHESKGGTYVVQKNGPAKGIFQMEPATHDDIWDNFINNNSELKGKIEVFLNAFHVHTSEMLTYNLKYACIMCRIDYFRIKQKLPMKDDLESQAKYWKLYYNTLGGKGTVDEYMADYKVFVGTSNQKGKGIYETK